MASFEEDYVLQFFITIHPIQADINGFPSRRKEGERFRFHILDDALPRPQTQPTHWPL